MRIQYHRHTSYCTSFESECGPASGELVDLGVGGERRYEARSIFLGPVLSDCCTYIIHVCM